MSHDHDKHKHVDVAVLTTSGMYPAHGFDQLPEDQHYQRRP